MNRPTISLSIAERLKADLAVYNKKYQSIWDLEKRLRQFYKDVKGANVLATSSFGATSGVLLHLISKVNPTQKIHFIDTSYHFQETWDYKEALTNKLGLDVITVKGDQPLNQFSKDVQLWKTNNQICCHINKVQPLNEVKGQFDFWLKHKRKNEREFIDELFEVEEHRCA